MILKKFIQVEIGTGKICRRKKKNPSHHRKASCICRILKLYMTRNLFWGRNTTCSSIEAWYWLWQEERLGQMDIFSDAIYYSVFVTHQIMRINIEYGINYCCLSHHQNTRASHRKNTEKILQDHLIRKVTVINIHK